MQRQANGIHLGLIPEAATAGGHVEYYIEARGANGKRMTSRGSSVDPLVVTLSAPEVARLRRRRRAGDGPSSVER